MKGLTSKEADLTIDSITEASRLGWLDLLQWWMVRPVGSRDIIDSSECEEQDLDLTGAVRPKHTRGRLWSNTEVLGKESRSALRNLRQETVA